MHGKIYMPMTAPKKKPVKKEESSLSKVTSDLNKLTDSLTSKEPAEKADKAPEKPVEEADDDIKDEDLLDEQGKMEADIAERSKKDDAPAEKDSKKSLDEQDPQDLISKLLKAQLRSKYLETQVKALGRVSLAKATEKELKLALKYRREKRTYDELSKYLTEHLK